MTKVLINNKHSSKPSQLHFTEKVNKLDVESLVDNNKQDKRSQRTEEISMINNKLPEFEKNS